MRTLIGKLEKIPGMISTNGWIWTFYFIVYYALLKLFGMVGGRLVNLERKYLLPGWSTAARSYNSWQTYDWQNLGEEWSLSPKWKQYITDEVLLKYIEPGKTVLEIGPGAGRWSEPLQKIAKSLILVDIADKCIEICKERFSACGNIRYFVGGSSDLDFIRAETIDFIWSWDVFILVNCRDADEYVRQFSRVLKPGGRGIVNLLEHDQWSGLALLTSLTDKVFNDILTRHGLRLVTRVDYNPDPGPGRGLDYSAIVVFEKRQPEDDPAAHTASR